MNNYLIIGMFKDIIRKIVGQEVDLKPYMQDLNHSLIFTPETYWMGVPIGKSPLDAMILQEIIFEKRPDVIIECGTGEGGSALFMANMMDITGIDGKVITIDNQPYNRPQHPKIVYMASNCLQVERLDLSGSVMAVLDCDHSYGHVLSELEHFSGCVTPGQYLIVEDTDGDGPDMAVKEFMKSNMKFRIDRTREKYGISSNIGGYLLRL